MICSEVITKANFESYLKNVIVNKRYLALIMVFFDQIKDISIHEKIMFLLYNEYMSIEDLLTCTYHNDTINTMTMFPPGIENLLSIHEDKWKNPYAFIRDDFFRNYVTTLTFEHYEDIYNIKNQLAIVYSSLSEDEVTLLANEFSITKDNLIDLVRVQTTNETIELSAIERDSDKLNKITTMLSGIKDYRSAGVANRTGSDYETDTLKSVLKKIDLGTIH